MISEIDYPIRILQIVTQMNQAGLESRLMDIYRNIDRSCVQFDFYTCHNQPGFFDDEIKEMGGKVYYNDSLDLKVLPSISRRFKSFLSDNKEYKIVHCHLNQWCGLVLKGAKQANVPVRIAHSRTSLQKFTMKNIMKNLIKLPTNRYATHYFAVSRKAGEWLFGKKMVTSGKVKIWPNAIDCKKFIYNSQKRRETRDMLGLDNELALMHVGNIRPEKNHAFLFEVFKQVLKEQPSAKLILAGRDMMGGAIQSLAKEMGIDKAVLFLGSRSDVPDLLQAGDVFVFPSLYEGFPGAVLEAEAAGLPCIISNTITDEVCLTAECVQLSLSASHTEWVDKILELSGTRRHNKYALLRNKGYDIHLLAKNMQDFYIEELKA